MYPGGNSDHSFSRSYSLRDQLLDLGKDMHLTHLVALVVNVAPHIYEPVQERHCNDNNYFLHQIQSTVSKICYRKILEISIPASGLGDQQSR